MRSQNFLIGRSCDFAQRLPSGTTRLAERAGAEVSASALESDGHREEVKRIGVENLHEGRDGRNER